MPRLLLFALASAGLLWLGLAPQWQSFERMGRRRFQALAQPRKELLVGVVWPFANNQDGLAAGLQLAKEELAASGLPVRLEARDPGIDPERTRRVALEFANTPDMSAVLGYYEYGTALNSSVIYDASRLLLLDLGCTRSTLPAADSPYFVRTILSGDKVAQSLARMLVARGYRRIALIYEEDVYGNDLAFNFQLALDTLDAQLVSLQSFQREVADFQLPVNELKAIDADIILFAGLEPWAGQFLRCARAVGLKTPILGGFNNSPLEREQAGPALEGAMYVSPYNPDSPSPENQTFVRAFQARFGKRPDAWAAQGYDTLRILANAARFTGSRNPRDLAFAIRYMPAWEGANGRYQFDSQGELLDKPIYINTFEHGAVRTSAWPSR